MGKVTSSWAKKNWDLLPALIGLGLMGTHLAGFDNGAYPVLAIVALLSSVFASVKQSDAVAHHMGDPLGPVILAIAITVIEVGLVVSLMWNGGPNVSVLARDTVFSGAMILLNGIMGISLFAGSLKNGEMSFSVYGVSSALSVLAAILVLTLVFPNYTTTVPGPVYSQSQLIFIAVVSLILYGTFLLVQAVYHRDYFVVERALSGETRELVSNSGSRSMALNLGFLILGLFAVVTLGKSLAPTIEGMVVKLSAPQSLVGVVIAMIVLLPEGISALQAALRGQLQNSLNLTLGSCLASIGLTIPAVALISLKTGLPLTLGLDPKESVLIVLSLFVAAISLSTGKTTILQGAVHLVIFAVYLFMTVVP